MMKRLVIACMLSLALLAPAGCATRTVVTAETPPAPTVIVEDDDDDDGLFGIVGDIIALPFRAVGALLSAIF